MSNLQLNALLSRSGPPDEGGLIESDVEIFFESPKRQQGQSLLALRAPVVMIRKEGPEEW